MLNVGSTTINAAFLGAVQINKAYLGADVVLSPGTLNYSSWADTGIAVSTSNFTYHCPMGNSYVAVANENGLSMYYDNGVTLVQVGNTLATWDLRQNDVNLAYCSENRVWLLNGFLRLSIFEFDGTDWSELAFLSPLGTSTYPVMSYLSDNSMIMWNRTLNTIQEYVYDPDLNTISTQGNPVSTSSTWHVVEGLSANRFIQIDYSVAGEAINLYGRNGSDWDLLDTYNLGTSISGSYQPGRLNSLQFITWVGSTNEVQTFNITGDTISLQGSKTTLTASSWPRKMSKLSDTRLLYNSYLDSNLRVAEATLAA